jgi:hypothetical protein
MRAVVASIEGELERYRLLAEGALRQLDDEQAARPAPGGGNSVAVHFQHLGGNLRSRFTDFLSSDGEKPWRERDVEFASQGLSRDQLLAQWDEGWGALRGALAALGDDDLDAMVVIRGQSLSVVEALHRALGHVSYHVGQIVQLARAWRGDAWEWLSIPPGRTQAYNRTPTLERRPDSGDPGRS